MDGKQFFASVIGSLAWPAVIVFLLIMVREQIKGLAERLLKLSLPGGVEASFREELVKVREEVKELVESTGQPEPSVAPTPKEVGRTFDLANQFPAASIVESFAEVESELNRFQNRYPNIRTPSSLMVVLVNTGVVDQAASKLFDSLRRLRNIATHDPARGSITAAEALEYRVQARSLVDTLEKAYLENPVNEVKVQKKGPHSGA